MRSHWNFLFTAISIIRITLAFCANAVTAVFSSLIVESWHRRKWRKNLGENFPRTRNCQNKEKNNSKSTFFFEKAWGEVPGCAICWGWPRKMAAKIWSPTRILQYILSSLGKLYIRIDRGTSCHEDDSDEDDNYDDIVATNEQSQSGRSQRQQSVWQWANHGDELT